MDNSNAEQLIEQCAKSGDWLKSGEGETDFGARCRLAVVVGALSGAVRSLCAELDAARSPAGIAAAIAELKSSHEGLLVVLKAVHERMDAEHSTIRSYGFGAIVSSLEDAITSLEEDCGWHDADELAAIERQVRAEHDSVEWRENREDARDGRYGRQT